MSYQRVLPAFIISTYLQILDTSAQKEGLFLCAGAYPGGKHYDTNLGKKEELSALKKESSNYPCPL